VRLPTEGSVLDHPVEKQREYAARSGLSLEQWREETLEALKRADEFTARLDADETRLEDLSPVEREAWERFQARVDDETLTHAVIQRRQEAESGNP